MQRTELIFEVEQQDGAFVAVCRNPHLATQADSLDELEEMIRDLMNCAFEEDDARRRAAVRLHFVKDPVLFAAA